MNLYKIVALFSLFVIGLHSEVEHTDLGGFSAPIAGKIKPAEPNKFPWHATLVAILPSSAISLGGGSLISDQWVLTTAYFLHTVEIIYLHFGSPNASSPRDVGISRRFKPHPMYMRPWLEYDIALIYMDIPIRFTSSVWPISLPERNDKNHYAGAVARLHGFSRDFDEIFPQVLMYVDLTVLSSAICEKYDDMIYGELVNMTVCAQGISDTRNGPCLMDQGTALAINNYGTWIQIGLLISSCPQFKPLRFSRITYYLDWIEYATGIYIP